MHNTVQRCATLVILNLNFHAQLTGKFYRQRANGPGGIRVNSDREKFWRVQTARCVPSSKACSKLTSNHLVLESDAGVPIYVLGVDHLARQFDLGMSPDRVAS